MVVGEADNGHGGGVFVVAHSACSLATAWMTTGGRGGAATATKGCRRRRRRHPTVHNNNNNNNNITLHVAYV